MVVPGQIMVVPLENDLKVATDPVVAGENPKDMTAKVAGAASLAADIPRAVAASTGAAAARVTGAVAGKTSATTAADMAIR